MTARASVLVSRQWHAPTITVAVTAEDIGISMPLEDFLTALVAEVGSPALTMTRAQLAQKLSVAADRIVAGMKDETARVW